MSPRRAAVRPGLRRRHSPDDARAGQQPDSGRPVRLHRGVQPRLDRLDQRHALPRAPRPSGRQDTNLRLRADGPSWRLLAVFTGNAASDSGAQFALTYVAFLLVVGWLFYSVSKLDTPELARSTRRYASIVFVSAVVIADQRVSAPDVRVAVWAAFVASVARGHDRAWVRGRARTAFGIAPTESLVERLDTFTLIVLGEVVVGVVAGLTAATAELRRRSRRGSWPWSSALGMWWIYFDIVGGRAARKSGAAITAWILSHLPITLAIAGRRRGDGRAGRARRGPVTPQATAWLLAGAVAVVLLTEIATVLSFVDGERDRAVYRPLLWRWPWRVACPLRSGSCHCRRGDCARAQRDAAHRLVRAQPLHARRRLPPGSTGEVRAPVDQPRAAHRQLRFMRADVVRPPGVDPPSRNDGCAARRPVIR